MISKEIMLDFRQWFEDYTGKFELEAEEWEREGYRLKKEHTYRVCREIKEIGRGLGMGNGILKLAESLALFHDIGRFEQFKKYGTFADDKSVDHADLGIEILEQYQILDKVDNFTKEIITKAIKNHNKKELPSHEGKQILFFTRLLRDADKLDIYRILMEYYKQDEGQQYKPVMLGLRDTDEVTPSILESVFSRKISDKRDLRTVNDFKLMQISWVYDVNFLRTFQIIRERSYLSMIYKTLPSFIDVEKIRMTIREFIDKKCLVSNFSFTDDFMYGDHS